MASAAIVAVVLVAGSSSLIAGAFDGRSPLRPAEPRPEESSGSSPLNFEAEEGWHVRTTDPDDVEGFEAQAWASNVPFPADEEPIGTSKEYPANVPDKTEDALPADGILLEARIAVDTRNPLPPIRNAPVRNLPLTIDEQPHTAFEGSDPDRAMTIINATVNGRYTSVRIVFGTGDPSAELVREAEEELERLIVGPPPRTTEAIDDFGIRMNVPDTWHGLLFSWSGGAEPMLIVGTKPINDLYHASTRRALDPADVLVLLAENTSLIADYEPVDGPIAIRADDLCPTCEILDDGTSPPAGHSLFYRSFAVGARQFDLFVEFGASVPNDDQFAGMNEALATLRVQAPPPTVDASDPVPEAPISVDVPEGWVSEDEPVPGTTGPRVVAAYGTWELERGGVCGPEAALQNLPVDGALIWFVEHVSPGNAGDYTEPGPRFIVDLQTPPARWRCAAEAPSRMYPFRVDGRYFDVHLALGPQAGGATIRQAEALIASLRGEGSS